MEQASTVTEYLERHGYKGVPLRRTALGHLEVDALVNGHAARMVVDTGAGVTVIDRSRAERWRISSNESPVEAVACGAGGSVGPVGEATVEELKLSDLDLGSVDVMVMDLSQVNAGLEKKDARPIDGIVGADLMVERRAIIEYATETLHLRRDGEADLRRFGATDDNGGLEADLGS